MAGIDFDYLSRTTLPNQSWYYPQVKILLFPNCNYMCEAAFAEICKSGLPVITTPLTGIFKQNVIHDRNGYVLPLNQDIWANHICDLLKNPSKLATLTRNALQELPDYN